MDWKDACNRLQKEGLKFDFCSQIQGRWFSDKSWIFTDAGKFRIAAQPIPDREDWREWCRNLKKLGVEFESQNSNGGWVTYKWGFKSPKTWCRIPAQPIPAGIEKYLEEEMAEQKQDKPEIPHRELQIQWHEDWIHALKTEEEMREWEVRLEGSDDEWITLLPYEIPDRDNCEYRRKPRTVTYWHCIVDWHSRAENKDVVYYLCSTDNKSEVKKAQESILLEDPTVKFSPIIETTVELED